MKKFIVRTLSILTALYIGGCAYMYFKQESFLFHPDKMSTNVAVTFSIPTNEVSIPVEGATLSAIYAKIEKPKGLIFFLHGNSGNLKDQEDAAVFYTGLGYDFFTLDYRSFGKSTGENTDEKQFFKDVQTAYDSVKRNYPENKINVVGYSLGTASAAMITAKNNPKDLLLIAPYYSMSEMAIERYKIIPTFLLKYKFDTYKYVESIKKPILIFHGDKDDVIPFECSKRLAKLFDADDLFVPIKNQDHNHFEQNELFKEKVTEFLNR